VSVKRESKLELSLDTAFRQRRAKLGDVIRRNADAQDEEDLYQDAFVRIVERANNEDIPKVDNLLRHVVRCLAIDRLRRKAARQTFTSDEVGEHFVDAAPDPERQVMSAQRFRRVMAAIDSMPPRRREAFMLHRVDELTYAQVARRMNVTIKAVEKHIHLAMRQLSDTDD
jgi:RNA polymerase sigma factor (sigma-70 family)